MCEDLKKILPYISDTSQKKAAVSQANKNSDSKKKPGLFIVLIFMKRSSFFIFRFSG